jgi:hypothetical protein
MPTKARYPEGWKQFSLNIRQNRALERCECAGECGLHRDRRCVEQDREQALWAQGRVILTVAHLCDCEPLCAQGDHVKAMCQRCHNRLDVPLRTRHRRERREREVGQGRLDLKVETRHGRQANERGM